MQHIIEVGENHIYLYAPVKAELWYGDCKSLRANTNKANLELLLVLEPLFVVLMVFRRHDLLLLG